MSSDVLSSKAEAAIDLCVKKYSQLSDDVFFQEVDRAYVHVSSDKFGVLFAHGEVGTFGERSKDYRAYLSCGVLDSGEMEVYFLGSPNKDPLLETGEAEKIEQDFYKGRVVELFYERDGDKFVFAKSQDFVEPKTGITSKLD